MHLELKDKYAKMAKQMGLSSSVDQLLTNTDLTYNAEVMVVPLPPKFKVPQMEGTMVQRPVGTLGDVQSSHNPSPVLGRDRVPSLSTYTKGGSKGLVRIATTRVS